MRRTRSAPRSLRGRCTPLISSRTWTPPSPRTRSPSRRSSGSPPTRVAPRSATRRSRTGPRSGSRRRTPPVRSARRTWSLTASRSGESIGSISSTGGSRPAGSRAVKSLCVFCGANAGHRPFLADTARAMGDALARRGITLVFGGGRVGLMGAVSAAARAAGGRVVGVIPAALQRKELAYEGADLTELIVVRSMHERKARMAELADGFAALPGGYGTCEEICEMITWAQLGIHRKPCGLVNVDGYFDGLLAQFDRAVAEGLLRAPHRGLVVAAPDPDGLLDAMVAWAPPPLEFKLDWQST